MAPRNSDASTSYKKKNFPVEDSDVSVKDIVPCLLHKKHKVVKLVKTHMRKIQDEGLLCGGNDVELIDELDETQESLRLRRAGNMTEGENNNFKRTLLCWSFLMLLVIIFLLIFLMVWISSGPLSNSMAHTPFPVGSFVRTEGLCTLEKKYLLRWSKPEYFQ